jgi:hypothetical protein
MAALDSDRRVGWKQKESTEGNMDSMNVEEELLQHCCRMSKYAFLRKQVLPKKKLRNQTARKPHSQTAVTAGRLRQGRIQALVGHVAHRQRDKAE